MSVYVDDARIPYGYMRMSHMVADSSDELHAMARRIGVARRWCQQEGAYREHYDVSQRARADALQAGAVPITRNELAQMLHRRRPLPVNRGPL